MPPHEREPHPTWEPELPENDRKRTWKEAAGSNKTLSAHAGVRHRFTQTANEHAATVKNGVNLDDNERTALKRQQDRNNQKPKKIAATIAWRKAKSDEIQTERAADSKARGVDVTTEFGLWTTPRAYEIEERVHEMMQWYAGAFLFDGGGTSNNWIRDNGEFMSLKDVLATGEFAAYFLVTKQKITSGQELKCTETTKFLSECDRDPLWRTETRRTKPQVWDRPGIGPVPKHINDERDLRRFTVAEAKTVVRSYLLAKCVSSFDATSLEGGLQRYIEDMGMPHGLCLHKEAGAGSKREYGNTKPETTWVALSLIRVTSLKFAEVDLVYPTRSPPLTSCTVTSHNGENTYNVSVRGPKQKFPSTKSVLEDEAKIAATRLQTKMRRKKRKADAISTTEDDKSSE